MNTPTPYWLDRTWQYQSSATHVDSASFKARQEARRQQYQQQQIKQQEAAQAELRG